LSSEYLFEHPVKLNFIAIKDGFLVFRDGDALSGLTLKVPSITVAITTLAGKEITIASLSVNPQSSLVILDAKNLYISPSNDSAIVSVEYYSKDEVKS
jgi:hypothetical protein